MALIPAATLSWPRLIGASVLAGGLTAAAQGPSHDVWIWWAPLVAGLALMLALAYPRPGGAPGAADLSLAPAGSALPRGRPT